MLLSCHQPILELIYTLQLPVCQGIPCPKQAWYVKGEGGRALILTYLDSPMAEFFPHHWLYLFDFAHLQKEMGGQSWTKSANFGPSLFHQNSNPLTVLFVRVLPLVSISAISTIFGGVMTQKPPKKGYFMDAESTQKLRERLSQQPQIMFGWNLTRLCIFIRV